MAGFLLVHGGFGGGWEWSDVAGALRARGHLVRTPTLRGLGEEGYDGAPVTLAMHVEDVVAAAENLDRVVLVAASYSGVPALAAADRLAATGRLAALVLLDALLPHDGEAAVDLLPVWFADSVREGLGAHGPGWRVPVPDVVLPPPDVAAPDVLARYVARLRPQPVRTWSDPVTLTGACAAVPRVYVACTRRGFGPADGEDERGGDPITAMAVRAREEGWDCRDLDATHDAALSNPAGTADLLDEIGRGCGDSPAPGAGDSPQPAG